MKKILISAVISTLFLYLGCVPLHLVERAPDEKTLASIKAGTTNKEEVLMMLGEPDRVMEKEKFFQYWWKEVQGVVGGYFGGFFGYTYSLHIYFDENNVVKNFEIKRKGFAGMGKTYLPDDFLFELYSGKYAEIGIPGISEIELEKDGKGVWRVLGNETSFKWSIADNEIRLDTKSEIIIVQISDSVLEIPLQAGTGHRQFKKTK